MIYLMKIAGGNETVIETIDGKINYAERAKELFSLIAGAEQVGFADLKEKRFRMMGGEFCGNATRAAAVLFADFKSSTIKFKTSGFDGIVDTDVKKISESLWEVRSTFPNYKYTIAKDTWREQPISIVGLGGITHIVIKQKSTKDAVLVSRQIITRFAPDAAACGVIWLDEDRIRPIVYVKEVDTLFDETACGSGSMAVALTTEIKRVVQPTGKIIEVGIDGRDISLSSEISLVRIDRQKVYEKLLGKTLSYDDVASKKVVENGEGLVKLTLPFMPIESQAGAYPFARATVLKKLKEAQKLLDKKRLGAKLEIIYAYRCPLRQRQLFEMSMEKYSEQAPSIENRKCLVHKKEIAAPDVAGHPTGGAIDLQIVDRHGKPLDFGSKIWEFMDDMMTFSPFISSKAIKNRLLLREIMLEVGFAPFDGEWWHFSYGDREWAKFYDRKNAIYDLMAKESSHPENQPSLQIQNKPPTGACLP